MEKINNIRKDNDCPSVLIVTFQGRMDDDKIINIQQLFDEVFAFDTPNVVIDMKNVPYISSAVIGVLMGCRKELIAKKGNLALADLCIEVREILNVHEADKIFSFYKNINAAKNFFKWEFHGFVENVHMEFPSNISFVPPVRQFVRRIATQKGYTKRDTFRIETIVDEICNNAIEHGTGNEALAVELEVLIDRKKIEIKVTNVSGPSEIENLNRMSKYLSSPNTGIDDTRGRGLALVKMLSTDIAIDNTGSGTCVHVTKRREE